MLTVIPVCLKSCFFLPAGTEASVVVFTETKPPVDTDVVLEPRTVFQSEFSENIGTKNSKLSNVLLHVL